MPKLTRKLPSTIIAKAIKLMGPNGEHWNNHNLHHRRLYGQDTYCALGALSMAAYDNVCYPHDVIDEHLTFTETPTDGYIEAATIVAKVANSSFSTGDDVPTWNDDQEEGPEGYKKIKSVFCKALKIALKKEEAKATERRRPK